MGAEANLSGIDEAFIRAYRPATADVQPPSSAETSPPTPATVELPGPSSEISQVSTGPTTGVTDFFQVQSDELDPATSISLSPPVAEIPMPVEAPPSSPTVTPPSVDRRPLSTFASPDARVEAVFRPGSEVESFTWPAVCEELTTQWAGNFSEALRSIEAASGEGRSVIGIAGSAEGVGTTTLALALARLLSKSGLKVGLVDGDFTRPSVASRLGLRVSTGWEQVLSGDAPLAESVVYSVADDVAVLPLEAGGLRASEMLSSIHASVTAGVLRYHYDVVLVDLGSAAGGGQTQIACKIAEQFRLDAALVATDQADGAMLHQLTRVAPQVAAVLLGAVENRTTIAAAAG